MSAVNTKYTLADWHKTQDPDGEMAHTIEMLAQNNEIMEDIPFLEGNLPLGHQVSVSTALPTTTTRRFNRGTDPSKGREAQFVEGLAMFESRMEIDVKIADLNGNAAAYRASKAPKYMESMRQKVTRTFLYGNAGVSVDEFNGIMVRMSSLSGGNAANIIDCGGVGTDNASIILVVWGEEMVHGLFPKGHSAVGLSHEDLGKIDAFDANSKKFRAYGDVWNWDCGLAVPDWRWVVRACNIDISNLIAKTSAADLIETMNKMVELLPGGWAGLSAGKAAFYMNRTVRRMLRVQSRDAVISGGGLTYENRNGKPIIEFNGIPVRIIDQMLNTESAVV